MVVGTKVLMVQDNWPGFAKSIAALTKEKAYVGIPSTTASREDPDGGSPINNAQLGFIHEKGSPARNIPARPFLVPGVDGARNDIIPILRKGAERALAGDLRAAHNALEAVGLVGQNAVRAKITEGPFAPLAEATLEARKRAGFLGESPLIMTGQLRASISYVVRKG